MALPSMTFNGQRKEWLILERGREKAPFAPFERQTITAPGVRGGYVTGTNVQMLRINQPIAFLSDDGLNDVERYNELAEWLMTDSAVPLEFDDEPGMTYFAMLDTAPENIEKISRLRKGVLTFLCPDPYKYGPEQTESFSDGHVLTNEGTAKTSPVFRATAKQQATFIDIVKENGEYMRVGRSVDTEKYEAATRRETVMTDNLTTTTGWGSVDTIENTEAVEGTITSDGEGFVPDTWGYGAGWHGMAVKQSLSEVLDNFEVQADFEFDSVANVGDKIGRMEVHLLDESNNVIAKMNVQDTYAWNNYGKGNFYVGSHDLHYHMLEESPGRYRSVVNNGVLRIIKNGSSWAALIGDRYSDGRLHTRTYREFEDFEGSFTGKLAQVQFHFGTRYSFDPPYMRFNLLKVDKINLLTEAQIPYIVEPGDVIEVDHKKAVIRINGEERNDLKYDFGSDYFDLDPGINTIHTFPEGAYDTTITWRDAYK